MVVEVARVLRFIHRFLFGTEAIDGDGDVDGFGMGIVFHMLILVYHRLFEKWKRSMGYEEY